MIPGAGSYRLNNARLHRSLTPGLAAAFDEDGFALCNIAIERGKIESIELAAGTPPASLRSASSPSRGGSAQPLSAETIDLAGRIVLPCFVDCHTHIDKGHIWPRRPNPDGSFMGALNAAGLDRVQRWSAEDVARRMDFSLRCAYAHGAKAIRTHLDSAAPQDAISWPVFEEMRERWRGRMELQAACLIGIEETDRAEWFRSVADRVAAAGGVLGAVSYMVPDLDAKLDVMFRAAAERGLDLDFHADETADPGAASLRKIAQAALRHRFAGKVLVGHCCSLARQPDAEVLATLDDVARAGLAVVSLPMCNLYLQDRRNDGTTPRWRGVTLLHEMKARGIPVAVASDNTRDPFYPYGDLDMLEVYRMATRILHLDHPVDDWPSAIASIPAAIMRLADAGSLQAGAKADFVVFRGRSWAELLSRPETDRIVVRDGSRIDARVPDYAELDDLMR